MASLAQLSLLDICSRTVTSTQSHQVVLRVHPHNMRADETADSGAEWPTAVLEPGALPYYSHVGHRRHRPRPLPQRPSPSRPTSRPSALNDCSQLPVRRATSDPHRAQKDLEECRKRLQMAAIVNPQVDFTLVERRGRLLRSSSSTSTDRDRRTILRIAKVSRVVPNLQPRVTDLDAQTGSSVATFTNLVAEHPVEVSIHSHAICFPHLV